MSTPGYLDGTVLPNLPAGMGAAYKFGDKLNKLDFSKDPMAIGAEVGALAGDARNLVSTCVGTAMSAAADPLGWLINQGLSFLINICTPLKEAIQLVSGDGEALTKAAKGFGDLGKEIVTFGKELSATLKEDLKDWQGAAADAASTRMARFLEGVAGAADKAGDIAALLHISGMVVKVVEEFIRGLLADLIEWLIITWLAALATAPITLGGSTAAAGGVTAYKVASTTVKSTQKVSRLSKLLNKIKELIAKLQRWLKDSKLGQEFMNPHTGKGGKALNANQEAGLRKVKAELGDKYTRQDLRDTLERTGTSATESVKAGFGDKLVGSVKEQGKKLIGADEVKTGKWDPETGAPEGKVDPKRIAGKLGGYLKDGSQALDHAGMGQDQDEDKTRKDLDL